MFGILIAIVIYTFSSIVKGKNFLRSICVFWSLLIIIVTTTGCMSAKTKNTIESKDSTVIRNNTVIENSTEKKDSTEFLTTNKYTKELIYNLFDSGNSMDIGLVIGDKTYNTYTIEDRWYIERFNVLMSSFNWSLIDNIDTSYDLKNLYVESPYYIILQSKDKETSFTFFGNSNKVCYRSDGNVAWYSLTYYMPPGDDNSLAKDMRLEYENQDGSPLHIVFDCNGTAEDAAKLFVEEIFKKHYLNLAPSIMGNITDYQVVAWKIAVTSEDGNAILGSFDCAIKPPPKIIAGSGYLGKGNLEGWFITFSQFVLQKQNDGYWHCIEMGTGGATLPK